MSILSSIKGAVSKATTALKNTFAPSAEVSAQRRKDVFGTESKVVAGAAIVGGAVAAIAAAPVAVGGAATVATRTAVSTTAKAVAGAVAKTFIKAPLATTVGLTVGAPVVAGVIANNPKVVTTLPKESFKAGEKIGSFINENPKTAIALGAAGLIGGTLAAAEIASNKSKTVIETNLPSASLPNVTKSDSALQSSTSTNVPVTPATQVVPVQAQSTGVSTTKKRRRYVKKKPQNVNVRVVNAIQNKNYLNK